MNKIAPTAIAMTDNCVRLVRARIIRGEAHIQALSVHHLTDDSDIQIRDALREIAKHRQVRSTGTCLLLPRHLAILKVLKLPSQEDRELRQMVEIQISSQTPYSLDEVEYGYQVISTDAEGYTRVLLTVIPKAVSNRYIELASSAGIPLAGLSIGSFGLLGWFRYQCGRNRLNAASPTALCHIDINHSEICFLHNDRLIFSRSIALGLTELRADPAEMMRQIGLSIKYYQGEHMGDDISRFVVVADQIDLQEFVAQLEHTLQIPCELISTTEGIGVPRNLQKVSLREESGGSLSEAIGIQLIDSRHMVNLLPSTIRVSKQSKIVRRELIKLLVLGLIIYGAMLYRWSLDISGKENTVRQLRAAITGLDPQIDDAKRKMRLIEFFDAYAERRIFVPEIMSQLAKLIPADISLRALYLNEKCVFTIQGYAETREALNDFQAKLVNEPLFRKVNLEFATSRKIFNMQVTDFKFTSVICEEEI